MGTRELASKQALDAAADGTVHDVGAGPLRRLKRFAGLGWSERLLLLRALLLVAAIRLALCLLPFRIVRRWTQREVRKSGAVHSASLHVWAIRATSRYVPDATCLTQALAAQALLARSGYPSRIEIGVKKDEHRHFQAHAWLVCEDQIVIGRAESDGYVPLPAWEALSGRTD